MKIIVFLVVIVIAWIIYANIAKSEHYTNFGDYWDVIDYGKKYDNCYELNENDCMAYSNCGLCVKNGVPTCKPGDMYGPLFSGDCDYWRYSNYYDGFPFETTYVNTSRPWSRHYSDFGLGLADPISRSSAK